LTVYLFPWHSSKTKAKQIEQEYDECSSEIPRGMSQIIDANLPDPFALPNNGEICRMLAHSCAFRESFDTAKASPGSDPWI
ncbi:unnamed protein product, partial [Rotaria socialis]